MIVLVKDNVFLVYLRVHLDHEFCKASSEDEEHDCLLVAVGVEESAWDVDGGVVAPFVGVDGGSEHDAVSCYSW